MVQGAADGGRAGTSFPRFLLPCRSRAVDSVTTLAHAGRARYWSAITGNAIPITFCKGGGIHDLFGLCCCELSSLLLSDQQHPQLMVGLFLGQTSPVFLEFSTFKTANR